MKERIEQYNEWSKIIERRAEKYGFVKKNEKWNSIKGYLNTKDYNAYLINTSKIKAIEESKRYYIKHFTKKINDLFREEILKKLLKRLLNDFVHLGMN